MAIKRYYIEEGNEDGSNLIWGVPRTDLSDEQYDALPKNLQAQVDESGLYRKTAPSTEKKADANKKEEGGK